MKLLQTIFSITNRVGKNNKIYKVITILGIKFKFLNKRTNQLKDINKQLREISNKLDLSSQQHLKATGYLRIVQTIEFDILQEVNRICEKYNISYWLEGGTLLGAIRHKGFIPWDDDLDISMMQEDYLRFQDVVARELEHTNYIFKKNSFAYWQNIV